MRSSSCSPVMTILVLTPLLAVPLLAVFGIPQFEPTVASSSAHPVEGGFVTEMEDVGVGESIRYGADDLFAPVHRDSGQQRAESTEPAAWLESQRSEAPSLTAEGSLRSTPSPGGSPPTSRSDIGRRDIAAATPRRGNWTPPADALRGWILDADASAASPESMSSNPRSRSATPEPLTWQTAVRRLSELGVQHYQLQPGQRETAFHFSCSLTLPDHPRIMHRFEAEADDPLQAVQDVLLQVQDWHERR